jgi:ABC-type uncharacterized transport system substrate-binding protein
MTQLTPMHYPDDPTDADAFKAFPAAASALGLSARLFAVRAAAEFEAAFAAASRANLQGMHVSHAPLFTNARTTITALAALSRIPAVYGFREFAVEGGLMSYASSLPDVYRQQARMVDKILKGATPAELPIERTTKYVRTVGEISAAIQTLVRERANIVIVLASPLFVNARRQIASFALASRLPTVYNFRQHVEDGGLISYGVDLRQNYRRGAYFVDRILKGEKPGDLPMEFPTKVELVVNVTTAKAIGVTIPATLLARADEAIE